MALKTVIELTWEVEEVSAEDGTSKSDLLVTCQDVMALSCGACVGCARPPEPGPGPELDWVCVDPIR